MLYILLLCITCIASHSYPMYKAKQGVITNKTPSTALPQEELSEKQKEIIVHLTECKEIIKNADCFQPATLEQSKAEMLKLMSMLQYLQGVRQSEFWGDFGLKIFLNKLEASRTRGGTAYNDIAQFIILYDMKIKQAVATLPGNAPKNGQASSLAKNSPSTASNKTAPKKAGFVKMREISPTAGVQMTGVAGKPSPTPWPIEKTAIKKPGLTTMHPPQFLPRQTEAPQQGALTASSKHPGKPLKEDQKSLATKNPTVMAQKAVLLKIANHQISQPTINSQSTAFTSAPSPAPSQEVSRSVIFQNESYQNSGVSQVSTGNDSQNNQTSLQNLSSSSSYQSLSNQGISQNTDAVSEIAPDMSSASGNMISSAATAGGSQGQSLSYTVYPQNGQAFGGSHNSQSTGYFNGPNSVSSEVNNNTSGSTYITMPTAENAVNHGAGLVINQQVPLCTDPNAPVNSAYLSGPGLEWAVQQGAIFITQFVDNCKPGMAPTSTYYTAPRPNTVHPHAPSASDTPALSDSQNPPASSKISPSNAKDSSVDTSPTQVITFPEAPEQDTATQPQQPDSAYSSLNNVVDTPPSTNQQVQQILDSANKDYLSQPVNNQNTAIPGSNTTSTNTNSQQLLLDPSKVSDDASAFAPYMNPSAPTKDGYRANASNYPLGISSTPSGMSSYPQSSTLQAMPIAASSPMEKVLASNPGLMGNSLLSNYTQLSEESYYEGESYNFDSSSMNLDDYALQQNYDEAAFLQGINSELQYIIANQNNPDAMYASLQKLQGDLESYAFQTEQGYEEGRENRIPSFAPPEVMHSVDYYDTINYDNQNDTSAYQNEETYDSNDYQYQEADYEEAYEEPYEFESYEQDYTYFGDTNYGHAGAGAAK